jgi:abhydrolase domain-containing protein 17
MILIPIAIYLGLFLFAHLYAEKIIFQAQPSSYQDTDEILKLRTAGGELISAVYLKTPDSRYTILFSHGNAEDIGTVRQTSDRLQAIGFSVFLYDYRGYGTSSGKASEANSYEDVDAAYDYLVETKQVPPDTILVMGRSLGGAVAIDLASKRKVGGLIVESSFVTAFRVMTRIPLFPIDKFNSLSKIGNVHCPVLVIHGARDELIPIWHAEKLFQKANEPKFSFWVNDAGHNNLMTAAGHRYEEKLVEFATFIESRDRVDP